jgi:hypothetical protein
MNESLMKPPAASEYTGISIANLAQLRYLGKGPAFLKPTPRTVLYRKADLDAWLNASVHHSTVEGA